MLFLFAGFMAERIFQVFRIYLSRIASVGTGFGEEEVRLLLRDFFFQTGAIIFPVLIIAMILGIVGNLVQVGFMFTTRPLEFQLERLIPDFKRVLPVRRNFVNLLKVLVQVIAVGFLAYLIVIDDLIPMLKTSGMELRGAVALFGSIAFKLLIATGVFLLAIAIPDYYYQRFEYLENLKMSISDVKRELKEDVGDPMLRQRQRERAMQMRQNRQMLDEVPTADVIVTNPTHFAVALRYDPLQASAPLVVAKGADSLALMIRRIARENGVHIEENPPLARALYDQVEIGEEIPENFFRSIVLIFQKLERFRRMAR
jgi:flagellar biosynthetic protein FlhB